VDFKITDDVQNTTAAGDREIVPVGVHLMEIREASEGPNEYKVCDENPSGNCLKLRLVTNSGNYQFVFDDIPQHLGWRAKQLAAACGQDVASGVLSLNPDDLVGRVLEVEISHYTAKATGKTRAVVKKYMPAKPSAASKPKAAARTQAAKVTASLATDDIPF
jgi:hypothetical protein